MKPFEKPFEKGDKVISIVNPDNIGIVGDCGNVNGRWYMIVYGISGIQQCELFTKVNNRKERIEKLNLD